MTDITGRLLSTQEAADDLGVSRNLVQKLIKSGKLRATQIGRSYVIDPADLEAVRSRPRGGRPSDPDAPYHDWRKRYPRAPNVEPEPAAVP